MENEKTRGFLPVDPLVKIDDLDLVNVIQLQDQFGPIYYTYLSKFPGDYDL